MTDASTLYSLERGIATITLNRPDNRNALSVDLVNSLGDHLEEAINDSAARVIVLTNEGNTFCAGADLSAPTRTVEPGEHNRTFVEIFEMIIGSGTPVMGKINGHCMGGGVGLAAVLDVSVASTQVKFGFTEVRLGVAPAVISVVCLPKLRQADAKELFLTGERISAERAAEVGLINRAASPEDIDGVVASIAANITRGGPAGLAACKELIARVPHDSREDAFAWTAKMSAALFRGDEGRAGIAAFKEREDAPWVPQD
jgi:methylglutaconyl-CoA hydratase